MIHFFGQPSLIKLSKGRKWNNEGKQIFNSDGFVKSPSAALPPCDARRQAPYPCPVKCSLQEAKEANVRVSGSELPISENSLFNGVNHCGVQVSTPHSVGFARLASEAFYCAV